MDKVDKMRAEIKAATTEIATIANIPQDRREAFCVELLELISIANWRLMNRASVSPRQRETFEEIEAAVNALRRAFGKLKGRPKAQFILALRTAYVRLDEHGDHIGDFLPPLDDEREFWRAMTSAPVTLRAVRALAVASSTFVNKNPNRKEGGGSVRDWNFQGFVRELWACANKHEGALTANCKNNIGSGAMFKALERLRPTFDGLPGAKGFIRPTLGAQAQTIANIVKEARVKETRPSSGAAEYLKKFASDT